MCLLRSESKRRKTEAVASEGQESGISRAWGLIQAGDTVFVLYIRKVGSTGRFKREVGEPLCISLTTGLLPVHSGTFHRVGSKVVAEI